jgi:GNAT superfamily N-acetyltransferase
MSSPLDLNAIHQAIDEACNEASRCKTLSEIRRAQESDFAIWQDREKNEDEDARLSAALLFGVVATMNGQQYLSTFNLAYSTWDGRVLYLDRLGIPDPNSQNQEPNVDANTLVRCAFCDIALRCKCNRFTWQHFDHPQNLAGNIKPEYLDGWLTLHWDRVSMNKFAGDAPVLDSSLSLLEKMDGCLDLQTNGDFRLRLSKATDVDSIGRLVQGLADFEKEPDAVNMTVDQYRVDGFEGQQPLFYCFLLEDVSNKSQPYACGMAFCFLGCTLDKGAFIYLEDLFIEEKYRGKGAGSMVMRSLALLGQILNCDKLIWQALDWNTPALTFYNNIGAKVQDGLLTSRYAGQHLFDFVNE